MKTFLTLFVLFFSSSVFACEYWSKIENRPDELKDYNLGLNYIEANAVQSALKEEIMQNFKNPYLSTFFTQGDWSENPEFRWNLSYQVCFLSKPIDINEDGKEEVLVYFGLVGERISNHYLLQRKGGWKNIMSTSGIIYIQETKTNNYYDIKLYNCCGYEPSVCKYDGSKYVCEDG